MLNCCCSIIPNEFQMLSENTAFIKLALLKSGYSNLREKNGINYRNTLSLDAVLYIIACYYVDSDPFKTFLNSVASAEMITFMRSFTVNRANDKTYKNRNDILKKVFNEKSLDNLRIVDCRSSIAFIIENVIASMITKCFGQTIAM